MHEERVLTEDYAEFVILSKDVKKWTQVFLESMNNVKPKGVEPSEEQLLITKEFGGIYRDQTLFLNDMGDASIIAMFWPWEDSEHTTVKIAVFRQ